MAININDVHRAIFEQDDDQRSRGANERDRQLRSAATPLPIERLLNHLPRGDENEFRGLYAYRPNSPYPLAASFAFYIDEQGDPVAECRAVADRLREMADNLDRVVTQHEAETHCHFCGELNDECECSAKDRRLRAEKMRRDEGIGSVD